MPYVPDDSLKLPADDTVIWRYMDLPRLASLRTTESLWFTRLDGFSDRWEGGLFPAAMHANIQAIADFHRASGDGTRRVDFSSNSSSMLAAERRKFAANCWFYGEHESMLMWMAYARDQVALRSTMKHLKDSLVDSRDVRIGICYYEAPPDGSSVRQCMYSKRDAFRGENEVRALVHVDDFPALSTDSGVTVQIDVAELVKEVFTSPLLPAWSSEAVCCIVRALFPSASVRQSPLADPPPHVTLLAE